MDYQVTCHKPDGADADRRIDRLGGPGWNGTIDEVLASMDAGHTFWTYVGGYRANVIPKVHPTTFRRYVTTEADGFPPNNLLSLQRCP